jgi:hypothetical protein
MESCYAAQAGLELLCSSNLLASPSGVLKVQVNQCAWLRFIVEIQGLELLAQVGRTRTPSLLQYSNLNSSC